MIEQFRNKRFKSQIKKKYTDADGNSAIWHADQHELIEQIIEIIDSYEDQNYRLTSRQLYYQLVARDLIPNAMKVYTKICSILVDLRYGGMIDWNSIEDRGRVPSRPPEWDNIGDLIYTALAVYRLPRWEDQDYYIELYCEKQALAGVLQPLSRKYHIYFGANKGYNSASTMYEISKRMQEQVLEGKYARILYLGDHDPSGLDMIRDIQTRVSEFLRLPEDSKWFGVQPIALNMKQIEEHNPPSNPAQMKDPRAKWYIEEFGKKSWELDALEPSVLTELTEDAILNYIDMGKYNKWKKREKREAKKLKAFGDKL